MGKERPRPGVFCLPAAEGPAAGESLASARASELAERPHVNQQSAFHLGEGRSHLVIVFLRERCRQVLTATESRQQAPDAPDMAASGEIQFL